MGDYINLYKDYLCQEPIKQVFCGLAGLAGDYADLENGGKWTRTGIGTGEKTCYSALINKEQADGEGGVKNVVLSGGSELFNVAFLSSPIYEDNALLTDRTTQDGGTITNAFFISSDAENRTSWCLRISASIGYFGDAIVEPLTYYYVQTPYDGERQTWEYRRDAGSQWRIETPQTTQFGGIYLYSVTVGDIDYYLLLVGAGSGGTLHPTNSSFMLLIPASYFVDQIPKPYVGPVSKESAESAYIGTREKHSVLPRDISLEPNPYGFNSNGVYLCKCGRNQYNKIVNQIYTGLSGNPLNALGQIVSEVITSQGNRPRDEIQTMINGVLCCHSVPVLGGYPDTGSVAMTTLCGYPMFTVEDMTLATVDPLQQETYTTGIIPRPTGSFLDFSPYTAVSLTIPILGTVQLDPSAVLGKSLSLHFGIDLFAGVLSCDISIIEPSGTEWIYTTVQANCATDMQIMGSGAQGNPLLKIANALTDGATSPLASVYDIFDGLQMFSQSTPVSRVSHTGANLLLNPYHIYLTITTPDNFNAFNFWELAGIPSHMGGTVGMFSGYTVFEHVDLSAVSGATENELAEIDSALRGGVWL